MLTSPHSACIASIFRLHALYLLSKSPDFFWDGPATATWSCIELNVGIICASVSTLRPLFSLFLPKVFGSRPSYANRNNYVSGSTRNTTAKGKFDSLDEHSDEMKLREQRSQLSSKASDQGIRIQKDFEMDSSPA
jgi:hypothetical protein